MNIDNPSMVIESIVFNDNTKISFNKDDIVIFVGANNVGKSRVLKDIREIANHRETTNPKIVIVKSVVFSTVNFTETSLKNYFENNMQKSEYGDYEFNYDENHCCSYHEQNFKINNNKDEEKFYKVFMSFLSTENRLEMTNSISYNNSFRYINYNVLNKLLTCKDKIKILNGYLNGSFNIGIDVDYEFSAHNPSLKYKIGAPEEINECINLDKREAKKKLELLEDLHTQGDGIRSAVAILASLIVNDHSLFLIDEPETFLHPPQAKLLGRNIVNLSKDKQCFMSTHNIDLIRGILEGDSNRVKIIKIDREGNTNIFSCVDNDSVNAISNNKYLKYTNILNGLFYKQIVLCEDESDCKFYAAILESIDDNIYQNTLFCAVGGKDQFKVVLPLLKKLSISYYVIADIDLINDKDKLSQLLDSIKPNMYNFISEDHNNFLDEFTKETNPQVKKQIDIQKEIRDVFTSAYHDTYMTVETSNKIKMLLKNTNSIKLLKSCGESIIPPGECFKKYSKIKKFLSDNNIYTLNCGEIEKLVPTIEGHGIKWVEKVFENYPDMSGEIYAKAKDFIKEVFAIK